MIRSLFIAVLAAVDLGASLAYAQTPELVGALMAGCEAGSAANCVDAGIAIENGKGAPLDKVRAAGLQLRGCELGNGIGCANYATSLKYGNGVAKDAAKALEYYLRGCDLDSGYACSVAGAQHRSTVADRVGPVDGPKAISLYERGCELGYAQACRFAASALMTGTDVAKDEARSTALDEKGCQKGWAESCHRAGVNYLNGTGVPVDWGKQIYLLTRGCSLKFAHACDTAGLAYKNRPDPPPEGKWHDMVKASRYFRTGCELGSAPACDNLGVNMWNGQGFDTKLPNLAMHLFAKACAMKSQQACDRHANLKTTFKAVEAIDPFLPPAQQYMLAQAALGGPYPRVGVEAVLYAAELGQANAMYVAGNLYESGFQGIVKPSSFYAEQWWDKARKLGHADAAYAYAVAKIKYFLSMSQRPEAKMDALRSLDKAVELGSAQARAYRDEWRAASNENARLIAQRIEDMNRQNREARSAMDSQTVARAWSQFVQGQIDRQGERVCALIYEGQRTYQECMSKDHFDKYYTPNGG